MWRQSVTTGWGWQLKKAWFSFNFSFHTTCSLQLFPHGLSTRRKSVGKMKKKNREIKKRIQIICLICNKVVFLCLCHLNGLPNNLSCNWIFTTWIWISQQLFSKNTIFSALSIQPILHWEPRRGLLTVITHGQLWLTPTSTLIILDITKTSSNNCL